MAKVLGISRSGYYAAAKRPNSHREVENNKIVDQIKVIHNDRRQVYGSPRMAKELKVRGYACSENRVARLMRVNKIYSVTKRKFKVTTRSKHSHPVAPNLLQQNFTAGFPNQIWVSDITYVSTTEGWLYVAVIRDIYSRAVVGWSMRDKLTAELVIDAFNQAVKRRHPQQGLIFHSDRGVQYACSDFRNLLKKYQAVQSMSGKGNCYDNAVSESFFAALKKELVYLGHFRTRAEAIQEIFEYIEVFYNGQRLHSTLGYLSPIEFERRNSLKCA